MSKIYYNTKNLELKNCCNNKIDGQQGPIGLEGNGPTGPVGYTGAAGSSITGPTGIGCTGPTGAKSNFTGELIETSGPYESYLLTREFQEITNYLKIYINETPYWIPLISENPISEFPSPLYDYSTITYNIETPSVTVKWYPVPNAVNYKIFYLSTGGSSGSQYYLLYNITEPLNAYGGINIYTEINAGNVLSYEFELAFGYNTNMYIYAYDSSGNRSETPTTQLYLKYDGATINYSIWPTYIYIPSEGASNFSNVINGSGLVTILNNYYKSFFGPIDGNIILNINTFPQVNPYDVALYDTYLS